MALGAKGKQFVEEEVSETDLSDCKLTKEEYALMVSNPRKFAKKSFGRSKNRNWQGSYSSDKAKEESFNNSPKDEVKKEN